MSGTKKINSSNPKTKKIEKPVGRRDCTTRQRVNNKVTEESINNISMPADYTFKKYTEIKETRTEFASRSRLGKVTLSPHGKFLSRSLWLNHNSINTIHNIDTMVNSVFEYPEKLGFLDLSHNQLKDIDDSLLQFKNMKVLYLHDNQIDSMEEVFKLKQLKQLQHLTLYGNPFYDNRRLGNIRTVIKNLLPQIKKLDYNRLAGIETKLAVNSDVLRFLEEKEGRVPSYIPSKKRAAEVLKSSVNMKQANEGLSDVKIEGICCPVPTQR